MKKSVLLTLLSLAFLSFFIPQKAFASLTYTHSGATVSVHYDNLTNDLNTNECGYDPSYWVINVAYNDSQTYVESLASPITDNPISYIFNIPNGTVINLLEMWGGHTAVEASAGSSCAVVVDYSKSGIFTIGQIPTVTNLKVSNITDTAATITWDTDIASDSTINYGTDTSYGNQKSDTNLVTSHTMAIALLKVATVYHFSVKSTEALGNTVTTADSSFTTAQLGSTTQQVTVTVENTVTKTVTVTPTPTPTPAPDTTPPSIFVTTDFSKPFANVPKITGSARDDKAVTGIDYSLDGGQNWSPVDNMSSQNSKSTNFDFIPQALDDGNYDLVIRATDSSGNKEITKTYTLVIDRLPPQVSGVLFSLGPQVINPNTDGSITMGGQSLKITLSEVGGSTKVNIIAFNLRTHALDTYPLTKNPDNGLWSGTLPLEQKGEYQLKFSALDGANNKKETNLNKVVVVDKGFVQRQLGYIADAKITVFYQEPVSKTWQVWDGGAYSQPNPQNTDKNGNYSLFLPAGKYYIQTEADGYQTLETEFFTIDNAEPINANFSLKESKLLFSLGIIKIYYPDFSAIMTPFIKNIPQISSNTNPLIGKQAPFFNLVLPNQGQFDLNSLKGKPTVISFLNTWSPSSSEQVSILDKLSKNNNFNSVTIIEGDKNSKVYVFQKRGGYSLNMIADSDATLVIPYGLNVLPMHYFLDRKGIVRDVVAGVLSQDELENTLLNISD